MNESPTIGMSVETLVRQRRLYATIGAITTPKIQTALRIVANAELASQDKLFHNKDLHPSIIRTLIRIGLVEEKSIRAQGVIYFKLANQVNLVKILQLIQYYNKNMFILLEILVYSTKSKDDSIEGENIFIKRLFSFVKYLDIKIPNELLPLYTYVGTLGGKERFNELISRVDLALSKRNVFLTREQFKGLMISCLDFLINSSKINFTNLDNNSDQTLDILANIEVPGIVET